MTKRIYHADDKRPEDERDQLIAEAMIALKHADRNHLDRVIVTFG